MNSKLNAGSGPSGVEHLLVVSHVLRNHVVGAVFAAGIDARLLTHRAATVAASENLESEFPGGLNVARRDKVAVNAVCNDFRQPADVRGDHRPPQPIEAWIGHIDSNVRATRGSKYCGPPMSLTLWLGRASLTQQVYDLI